MSSVPRGLNSVYRNIIPLALNVSVAMGTLLFAFSVYLTRTAAAGEFSIAVLSLAFTGSVIVRGLMAIPVGRYVDVTGIRMVTAVGALLGSGGLIGFALATEPWHLLAAWWGLIGPAGSLLFFEPAFVAVNQWVAGEGRPRALGVLTLIGGASGMVFIPASQWAVALLGWRHAVVGLGILLLLSGLTTAAVVRPPEILRDGPTASGRRHRSLSTVIRDRQLLLFTMSMMISAFAIQSVIAHRIALFEEAGIEPSISTLWAAVGTALSLPPRWFAPIFSAKFGAGRLHMLGIALVAIGTALLVSADSLGQMIAHFVVFGLSFATLLPLRAIAMSERFAGPGYGSIMGAQWMLIMFAGALGPSVVGLLKQATGSYRAPVIMMVGLLGVSLMLLRRSNIMAATAG